MIKKGISYLRAGKYPLILKKNRHFWDLRKGKSSPLLAIGNDDNSLKSKKAYCFLLLRAFWGLLFWVMFFLGVYRRQSPNCPN
jgi:hypothetical protein